MNKRIISILIFLSSLIILTYGIVIYTSRINTVPIFLLVSPNKAEITVENKKIIGSQIIYLKPGTYDFKAFRDGFKSETIHVEVKKNKPLRIVFSLIPITQEAIKELKSSSRGAEIDKITTDKLVDEQKALEDANPIIKKLPIKNLIYSIGYRVDPNIPNGIIVEIDTIEGYRNAAINKIKEQGFDPSKLNIVFRNYANAFKE
ncbi:hypothetical protein TM074_00020 [Candidatus Nanosynbacter sp. TM7-074]|uniref:PEGA domain-containing protein n=1 Tax=Candidatus Nanosynbacter sp. TM7-074 TaxID=3158573 RepID=A0AB39J6A7_9BACT